MTYEGEEDDEVIDEHERKKRRCSKKGGNPVVEATAESEEARTADTVPMKGKRHTVLLRLIADSTTTTTRPWKG
jgi:hypothetical protein